MTDLLPCPFCGSKAIRTNEGGVLCGNDACRVIVGAPSSHFNRDYDPAAAWNTRASSVMPDPPQTLGEPVAWRCKDYADGWIVYQHEEHAKRYAGETGCLMQPLYAGPVALSRPQHSTQGE